LPTYQPPAGADEELFYKLALSFVPHVGSRTGRALLERFGSATAIFKAPLKQLTAIDGITEVRARFFRSNEVLQKAGNELNYALKHNVGIHCITDNYSPRLCNCADAPIVIFSRGNVKPDARKVVAIVGTRKHTDYGHKICEDLIEGLAQLDDILIVSGLALGIDAIAHRKCVQMGIPTIGVLGHGLDRIYPPGNRDLATQMMENGGILTEFPSGTLPDKGNFPMRNRIVAGMSDVTIVVESHETGGALITAKLAAGYNREVAAFPGRVNDSRSAGCNNLIRSNIAALITNTNDLLQLMNWDKSGGRKPVQQQLFLHLSPQEQSVVDLLHSCDSMHADELSYKVGISGSQLAATLLQLELQGIVRTLPGKHYRIH